MTTPEPLSLMLNTKPIGDPVKSGVVVVPPEPKPDFAVMKRLIETSLVPI